jgi:hypothetical protein
VPARHQTVRSECLQLSSQRDLFSEIFFSRFVADIINSSSVWLARAGSSLAALRDVAAAASS